MIGDYVELRHCKSGDLIRIKVNQHTRYALVIGPGVDTQKTDIAVLSEGNVELREANTYSYVLSYEREYQVEEHLTAEDVFAADADANNGCILLSANKGHSEGQLRIDIPNGFLLLDLSTFQCINLANPHGTWLKRWSLAIKRSHADPVTVFTK